jgi:iron complex transport system substrate-binding protein
MDQGRLSVVSLLPSATEIVCALGHERSLVGRSHECDFPASVQKLPALTAARLPVEAPSAEIDRAVKSLLSQALSIYEVDAARLAELRPDVVVTQSQCDVCAVSEEEVVHALGQLAGTHARVISLAPKRLADVFADLHRVGDALGAAERAKSLVKELQARVDSVVAAVAALAQPRPRVACIEWIDPPMGAGNWVPELVALAGGEPLFGEAGAHSAWLDWPAFIDARPDVIFVMPCGFDLSRTRAELHFLAARPGWNDLAARVFIVDGNQYFNRPGPRLVDSLELLAEAIWGLDFGIDFGRAAGWERVR